MSSKTNTKKKASTPSSEAPTKKLKVPKAFITRPCAEKGPSETTRVYISPDILEALELREGALIRAFKAESSDLGVIATVHGDASISEPNLVLLSQALRALGGLLLGDRVQISLHQKQPSYADSVSIHVSGDYEGVEDALYAVGMISPGLVVPVDAATTITITEVNETLENALNGLSLAKKEADMVLQTFIFAKGKTAISRVSSSAILRTKYPHLPNMVTFDQVGGLAAQAELLQRTVQLPLHNPTLFLDFGISPPRGVLLHGPPGTGKTMLLRCVANMSNAHVLTVSGPLIVSKYLGETENALRDIFAEARKYQPSIVFMDEIDLLAPNRASDDTGETELRVVATLLTQMDGMGDLGRVVVVGATNRPNSIDPALRRPGRFDQEVEIGIPDAQARLEILKKQFQRMNSAKYRLLDSEIAVIASKTHGYVGADLTALCREAVMKAIGRGLVSGTQQEDIILELADVEDALPEIRPLAMREIFLEMPKVFWSDIGGQEELKKKLQEVVQLPLEAASAFSGLGVAAPKGVLLYGPPGCSKTLTAKALATESGLNFLAVKGPEIFNKYVGELERTIREIFRKARAAAPSIIFFDEIDAISGDRESGGGTLAAQNVLTSLLNEIDGVEELKGVVIVAATNRPTEIDPALLRPGRLDRHIYVSPPDYEARLQILTNNSRKFGLDEATRALLPVLAKSTEGCSGAEVALLCQEAGLAAIMEDRLAAVVAAKHFEHALAGISRGITPEMIAYYSEFAQRSGLCL